MGFPNYGATKCYDAGGTILPYRCVALGAADYRVVQAASATDLIIGASTEVDATAGERVDVVHEGIVDLQLGGTVTRGALLTSDSQGRAVTAAPAAGVNNRLVGLAIISGVSGDIIPVLLLCGSTVQG